MLSPVQNEPRNNCSALTLGVPHLDKIEVPWIAFPFVLVRVPAIPRTRMSKCRYQSAVELHNKARMMWLSLQQSGEQIGKAIYEIVPKLKNREDRRSILELRRALFNVRPLPEDNSLEKLQTHNPVVAEDIRQWGGLQQTFAETLNERSECFARDSESSLRHIFELLGDKTFRRGLTFANPAVAEVVYRIRTDGAPLTKSARQALSKAMRYLWRATMKPTPCGFLASSCIAPLLSTGASHLPSFRKRLSHIQANRLLLGQFAKTLLNNPAVRELSTLRLSPTCFVDAEGCWTLVKGEPGESFLHVLEGERMVRLFTNFPPSGISWSELSQHGLSSDQIEEAIRLGVLECGFSTSPDGVDELEVLSRVLWQALPQDLSLIEPLQCLEDYENYLESVQRFKSTSRPTGQIRLRGGGEDLASSNQSPLAFEDTFCADHLALNSSEFAPFFSELAQYGAGYLFPEALPEEQVISEFYRLLHPDKTPTPFLTFYREYLAFGKSSALVSDYGQYLYELSRYHKLTLTDPIAPFRESVLATINGMNDSEVAYHPPLAAISGWNKAEHSRMSVRFVRASAGTGPARFHPVFWGGERMSLFPRYGRLVLDAKVDLPKAFRAWMKRWPDVADINEISRNVDLRPQMTEWTIDASGSAPGPNAIALRDLSLVIDADDARLMLIHSQTGRRVTPIFLGVSAAGQLSFLNQFLLLLSRHRVSLLEIIYRALNDILLGYCTTVPSDVITLPALTLGKTIVLSPKMLVVPQVALPCVEAPINKDTFFEFQDWLEGHGFPHHFAMIRVGSSDPLWVDFAHPEGINNFLRHVRGARAFLVSAPLMIPDDQGLQSKEGSYEVEYYAELAAGQAAYEFNVWQ